MTRSNTQPSPQTMAASIISSCACHNVRRASRAVTSLYDRFLAPAGLFTTQFLMLQALALRMHSVRELAERLGMDETTTTRALGPLAEKDLIESSAANDRRRKNIRLTATGRRVLRAATPHWEEAQRAVRERLGEERLGTLLELLDEIATLRDDG